MSRKLSSSVQPVSLIILLILVTVKTENVTCSNSCQLQDKDSSCWMKARNYFHHDLISAINNYASVETMIHMWQTHHGKNLDERLNLTLIAAITSKENAGGPLASEDMEAILHFINKKTKNIFNTADSMSLSISCPAPCDYINNLWIYLFVCSCIVVLLAIPIVATHLYFSRQNNIKYQMS